MLFLSEVGCLIRGVEGEDNEIWYGITGGGEGDGLRLVLVKLSCGW